MRRRRVLALAGAVLVGVSACASSSAPVDSTDVTEQTGLRVASFDFVESELLAEVYAQSAEAVGVPVVRLGAVGPREVVVPAMRNERVDLIPEYVGSALSFSGVVDPPSDPAEAAALLAVRVAEFGIDVLKPSAAVDSNVFVVSVDTAELHGLEAVSDLLGAPLTRFGGPAECPDRPFCLAGLRETYGVTFAEFVVQPSLTFTAEALRRDEVDVGLMFSTSPELDAHDLVALTDDRRLQPPENVAPLLRRGPRERWGPELEQALDRVSSRLSTEDLRRMNRLIADGVEIADVARDWLASLE